MATKTQAELAKAVLLKLGVIAADATPTAADSQYIIGEYTSKLEEWSDDDLVYWSANEIPLTVFPTVVKLMANDTQNAFGMAAPLETIEARETLLLKRLRRHMARGRTGAPIRALYY